MPKRNRSCRSCEWFQPNPGDRSRGWCHLAPMEVASPRPTVIWPIVDVNDWCAEWTSIDEAEGGKG